MKLIVNVSVRKVIISKACKLHTHESSNCQKHRKRSNEGRRYRPVLACLSPPCTCTQYYLDHLQASVPACRADEMALPCGPMAQGPVNITSGYYGEWGMVSA